RNLTRGGLELALDRLVGVAASSRKPRQGQHRNQKTDMAFDRVHGTSGKKHATQPAPTKRRARTRRRPQLPRIVVATVIARAARTTACGHVVKARHAASSGGWRCHGTYLMDRRSSQPFA